MAPQFTTQIGGSMTFSASLSASMIVTTNVTASRNYRPLVPDISQPHGPPAPLILSVEEANSLEHLADSVMTQTLADYLHFRDIRKRRLHDTEWKEVRRQNNLVAFKERESFRQEHQTLYTPDGGLEPVICKTSVPKLLVLGALQGTLDDEMFGMHIDGDNAARLRSSYIHDQVHDFRVLSRIRGATKDDPFRFCGVTWSDLGSNGYGPFAKKRDFCVVTSMGVTETTRGERVGYYVVHSVDVSSNGPMGRTTQLGLGIGGNSSKYTRAKGSMCWLKCELPNGGVELYMQGFFAPMGSVPEFAVVNAAVHVALGLAQTSDTSYSKKIRWMLHDSVRSTRRPVSSSDECVGRCKSHFGVAKKRKLGCCIVCRALVCSSCRTTRKVTVDVAADNVVQQTRCSICFVCMAYAKQTSAVVFALREMAQARARSNRALSSETAEYIL
ncbi:hypothetical protein PF005_g7387 [Phytophthora fragariae]|uniref:FYVE-type domain-containing protein n=1 Tax=Phytophthora fragariae TaxID=53985 RepID=A0A6A3LRA0_9STRA|nr:hypothetical protein PF003_g25301 [Phytophthora fragariae]KAE8942007.1 hypothetical protein PF009_g8223 [Phytophthora fragariae]KAE9018313.1 hypothetical protein PF011_g6318 [Phytophthora fragariae]KAE9121849.1 hypothetical protein PF007_g7674 [Phytophthora fragariae]KAE9122450.1 hypothetical protein PF010_g6736 [Phytophthora fragariae]